MNRYDTIKKYTNPMFTEHYPVKDIFQTLGEMTGDCFENINDILNQYFVDTATWSLEKWEEFLDIPIDKDKDVSYRREVIKAKITSYNQLTLEYLNKIGKIYNTVFLENMKNIVKPFNHPEWNLHADALVVSEYTHLYLKTNKKNANSYIDIKAVENKKYVFGAKIFDKKSYIQIAFYNSKNYLLKTLDKIYSGTKEFIQKNFSTPLGTSKIRVCISNDEAGEFNFKDLILLEYKDKIENYIPWGKYVITSKFITEEKGVPNNFEDFRIMIKKIIPAHLGLLYEFNFIKVKEVNGMTINQLNNTKLKKFAGGWSL